MIFSQLEDPGIHCALHGLNSTCRMLRSFFAQRLRLGKVIVLRRLRLKLLLQSKTIRFKPLQVKLLVSKTGGAAIVYRSRNFVLI